MSVCLSFFYLLIRWNIREVVKLSKVMACACLPLWGCGWVWGVPAYSVCPGVTDVWQLFRYISVASTINDWITFWFTTFRYCKRVSSSSVQPLRLPFLHSSIAFSLLYWASVHSLFIAGGEEDPSICGSSFCPSVSCPTYSITHHFKFHSMLAYIHHHSSFVWVFSHFLFLSPCCISNLIGYTSSFLSFFLSSPFCRSSLLPVSLSVSQLAV